jgi:serine phosphatase RsbU (regulator of sigma subunit)
LSHAEFPLELQAGKRKHTPLFVQFSPLRHIRISSCCPQSKYDTIARMAFADNAPRLSYSDSSGERTVPLDHDILTIGRSPDQDLIFPDVFVSRRHAVIERSNGSYVLVDLNSSHGTFLNGTRITRSPLKPGDTLQFGSPAAVKVRFLLNTDDEPSQSSLAGGLLSALSVFVSPSQAVRPAAREMEQLSFLLNAARQLNAGGAITDIFHVLLQLSIQLTGVERGFVFLREGNDMHLALGLRADGTIVAEDSTISRSAMRKAIESESKFSVSDTLGGNSGGAGAWASVMANSIRSIYCIPLRKRISADEPSRLLGLLYLDSQLGAGHLTEVDHEVLDTIATEAATLLHNALLAEAEMKSRLAAEELAVAARIHAGLMAIDLPRLAYAHLQAKTIPCLAIGGDFYTAIALEDCLGVAIADVSGKGVPAAIVAATLQGIIHALMLTGKPLAEIADLVNRFLCDRQVDKYATMILLKLFPDGLVEFANCGHVAPVHVTASGPRHLEDGNLIVGLIPGATFESVQYRLAPGERIVLTTDGITEAHNMQGVMFGEAGFDAIVHLDDLGQILDHVARFQAPNEADDDWTVVDIRYTGSASI